MSRHNRRRTRGGHKGKGAAAGMGIDHADPPDTLGFYHSGGSTINAHRSSSANAFGARHWHNRYMAWQARDRRQHEESLELEAAKRRLFGDPSGSAPEDDEALCANMLEYFGRLDFIE